MGFWGRLMVGLGAFREAYLNADTLRAQSSTAEFDAFSLWQARQLRYDLLWSFYQNNVFWQQLHRWSPALRTRFGLYKNTRQIFNPVHRLGEFGATHICGGQLDRDAGDGESKKSALPIETKNEAIRPAISKLWRDSRWAIKKSDWTRKGTILGDVGLLVCDDVDLGRPTLRVLHPGHCKWIERDHSGRITGYILEENRYDPRKIPVQRQNPSVDPRSRQRVVTYNEECWVEAGKVHFRTYLNYAPFDWRPAPDGEPFGNRAGAKPEWEVDYGFVPLVMVQHIDVGLSFGMAEPHALISKALEVDDVASNNDDQIRKILNAPWAILGCAPPTGPTPGVPGVPNAQGNNPTVGNPEPGRTESSWFYFTKEGADVKPMVAPMPLEEVGKQIDRINAEIEKEYPELRYYLMNEVGDTSGRALRVARQATETKVQERRTGYDEGLVLAQKMALAIGSIRGYEGYQGLDADDPDSPSIDHAIAHRPVFAPDPLDDTEDGKAFWEMVGTAVQAGAPLEVILEREGWPAADIKRMTDQKATNEAAAVERVKQRLDLAGGDAMGGEQ